MPKTLTPIGKGELDDLFDAFNIGELDLRSLPFLEEAASNKNAKPDFSESLRQREADLRAAIAAKEAAGEFVGGLKYRDLAALQFAQRAYKPQVAQYSPQTGDRLPLDASPRKQAQIMALARALAETNRDPREDLFNNPKYTLLSAIGGNRYYRSDLAKQGEDMLALRGEFGQKSDAKIEPTRGDLLKATAMAVRAAAPAVDPGENTPLRGEFGNVSGPEPTVLMSKTGGRDPGVLTSILNSGLIKDQATLRKEGYPVKAEPYFNLSSLTDEKRNELLTRGFVYRYGADPALNDAGWHPATIVMRESTLRDAGGAKVSDVTSPRNTWMHSSQNIGIPGPIDIKKHSGVMVVDPERLKAVADRQVVDAGYASTQSLASEAEREAAKNQAVREVFTSAKASGIPVIESSLWERMLEAAKGEQGAAFKRGLKKAGLLAGVGTLAAAGAQAAEAIGEGEDPVKAAKHAALTNLAMSAMGDAAMPVMSAASAANRGVQKIAGGDLSGPTPEDFVGAGGPAVGFGATIGALGGPAAMAIPAIGAGVGAMAKRQADLWPEPDVAEPGWRMRGGEDNWRKRQLMERLIRQR